MKPHLSLAAILCCVASTALAHDPNRPELDKWYGSLMRPDFGYHQSSCCGKADAYWCDTIYVKDGNVFCSITDDQDDRYFGRQHRPLGEVHQIPPEKMKFSETDPQRSKASNPTGHSVIFLSSGTPGTVFCFVQDSGI